jgi:MFS family permease
MTDTLARADGTTSSASLTAARATGSALALICAAQFVLQLDFSIVNVALPTIQRQLGVTAAHLQWVVTGYALTFGSLLLLGGRAGDVVGHRRLLLGGLWLFGLSSLGAGLSQSPIMLIGSRFAQGASAALVAPSALALLTALFGEGSVRTRALGMFQGATAAGAMAGVVLGGLLTEYIGWRAIFLVNPPLVVLLSVLAVRLLPHETRGERTRLDVAGAALVTAAVAALIFGLSEGQQRGFAAPPAAGSLLLAVILATAFVVVERRVVTPMLPVGLLADRARRAALGAVLTIGAVFAAYIYFIALYLQTVLHYSAVLTGVALVPGAATVMVVSMSVVRRVLPQLGVKRMLLLGLVSMGLGQLWLSHIITGGSYSVHVLAGLLLTAFGIGIALPTASVAVTAGVEPAQQGVAGGLYVAAQQIGIATGLAALATVAAAGTSHGGGSVVAGYRLSFQVAAGMMALAAVTVILQLRSRPVVGGIAASRKRPTPVDIPPQVVLAAQTPSVRSATVNPAGSGGLERKRGTSCDTHDSARPT